MLHASIASKILRWGWPPQKRDGLLKAALFPDQTEAQTALNTWLSRYDLDAITFADHRLLAAISERFGSQIKDFPEYPRLKGLQRQLWTQSRIRLNAVLPMLNIISDAGIEIMLIKGSARIATDPDAQRQRSQQDVDILVRPTDMRAAAKILIDNGWKTSRGDTDFAAIARASITRATNFKLAPWGDIDLHRCAYHAGQMHALRDAEIWDNAERTTFLGLSVLVPSIEERLAMMLAHGARSPESHSDWLIDAAELIKSGKIDWSLAEQIFTDRVMILQAKIALSYLANIMGNDFPQAARLFLTNATIEKNIGAVGTLLISRQETETPSFLRPLRRACIAVTSKQKITSKEEQYTPLNITIAKNVNNRRNKDALPKLALMQNIVISQDAEQRTFSKQYRFDTRVHFPHPGTKRRVDFELNTDAANIARFRVFVWRGKTGHCTARLRCNLSLPTDITSLTLEVRQGTTLKIDEKDSRSAKYCAVPFAIKSSSLIPLKT